MSYWTGGGSNTAKRRLFVSYHHANDQTMYDDFVRTFCNTYDLITDNSLDNIIDSEDPAYIMRRIREDYVTGSSCTVVLVGRDTWGRKFVDWEIDATLQREHGLIGVQLPTAQALPNGNVLVPDRLLDNINSNYAEWTSWQSLMGNPRLLPNLIELANGKPAFRIRNDRARRLRNA